MFDGDSPGRIVNYRPLFFAAVGFIAGIAAFEAFFASNSKPALGAVLLALCVLFGAAVFIFGIKKGKKAALVLAASFMLALLRMAVSIPESITPGEYRVSGIVSEVSEAQPNVVTLSRVSLGESRISYKVKLTVASAPALDVGDEIEASATLRAPTVRFGTYNERLTLLGRGICAVVRAEYCTVTGEGCLPVSARLYSIKSSLRSRIYEFFPENGSIAAGFLLGDKTGMDEAEKEVFTQTGTAHLLTLSGFHVGILTAGLFLILPKRFPRMRFILVGAFLLFYCAMTAFAPSLSRAGIMCLCVMAADVFERRADALSSLSLAALIILLVSPYQLYSVGFRLSFAATLGIILVTRHGTLGPSRGLLGKLANAAAVTLAATAATALISARYFGEFPVYGLVSNIIAVPIFSAAIVMSFIALAVGLVFPFLGYYAAYPADKLIGLAMRLLEAIGRLPYSKLEVISPSVLTGLLMLVLMFCVSGYVLRPIGKRLRLAAPVFLLFTASVAADIIRS